MYEIIFHETGKVGRFILTSPFSTHFFVHRKNTRELINLELIVIERKSTVIAILEFTFLWRF